MIKNYVKEIFSKTLIDFEIFSVLGLNNSIYNIYMNSVLCIIIYICVFVWFLNC